MAEPGGIFYAQRLLGGMELLVQPLTSLSSLAECRPIPLF